VCEVHKLTYWRWNVRVGEVIESKIE